jgi:hypothetical protein
MDIDLRPPMSGCLIALVTLMTLGLYPLLRRWGERHFIRRMDETGFETRGGKRIAWSEVKSVQRIVGKVNEVALSDEYLLRTARGRASLPLWRAGNAAAARDFLFRHVAPPRED